MRGVLRSIFINFFILLLLIISIELIFGHWFDKNNFGPYMREHRMKKVIYQLNYNDEIYNYIYKRNYHAFRGEEINPQNIKVIMVGGSTTDERYKPEKFTIVEKLNKKFKKNNKSIKINNAGVEGQSTRGHLSNFKYWFNKLKDFQPDYIIYYIGINDSIFFKSQNNNLKDGWIENPNKLEAFFDNIKSRSLLYDLIRKTKHKYYKIDENKRIIYDLNYSMKKSNEIKRNYLNFSEKIKKYNFSVLKLKYENIIKKYLNNVDMLARNTNQCKAIPIFINQPTQESDHSELLFVLNRSLINHCIKKNYKCVDLVKKLNGKNNFWWDGIYTTPEGSDEIANIIFTEIFEFFKN